jgi:hypothetical protein
LRACLTDKKRDRLLMLLGNECGSASGALTQAP